MDANDDVLAERWRGGDPCAAPLLVRRHAPGLRRYFTNKRVHTPDDLVQQTFAACFIALPTFRREASFRTFLFCIARNQLREYFRRQRRMRELQTQLDTLSYPSLATLEHEQANDVVIELAVACALQALPFELREVVELMYWSGRTQAEIAVLLGIPAGTVASRMRRAKARMRTHLIAARFDDADDDMSRYA